MYITLLYPFIAANVPYFYIYLRTASSHRQFTIQI